LYGVGLGKIWPEKYFGVGGATFGELAMKLFYFCLRNEFISLHSVLKTAVANRDLRLI
jgi:hypothetical protein